MTANKNVTVSQDGSVTAEYMLVMPGVAAQWLEQFNKMNRKPRERAARTYLESVENDEWDSLNGTTIVFDNQGLLADGQHRLAVIAESGKAMECLVVRGVRPEARSTIDDGIKRRFFDDLAMNGVTFAGVKDALLRKILVWDKSGGLGDFRNHRFAKSHLSRMWPQYAKEIEATEFETRRWLKRWPGNVTGMQFIYWLLVYRVKADIKVVNRFMSIISIGSQDPADEVLIRLRDKLSTPLVITANGHKRFAPSDEDVYWTIRAWNAWITQSQYRFTKPRDGFKNPYPTPVRADVAVEA